MLCLFVFMVFYTRVHAHPDMSVHMQEFTWCTHFFVLHSLLFHYTVQLCYVL